MADIVRLTSADEKACADINALLLQINKESSCTLEHLKNLAGNPNTELLVAREGGSIVGMATLVFVVKPAGIVADLEDVVVDESMRGKGVGRALCEKAIESARSRGVRAIRLTSRPERVAANKLYQKLGFERKETNVYRLKL